MREAEAGAILDAIGSTLRAAESEKMVAVARFGGEFGRARTAEVQILQRIAVDGVDGESGDADAAPLGDHEVNGVELFLLLDAGATPASRQWPTKPGQLLPTFPDFRFGNIECQQGEKARAFELIDGC